ncbi:MAG: response regulator [Treponema sp.]|nr:response regulator [Treponema sp.]MBR7078915.1 response regulator [Treponema sp.]
MDDNSVISGSRFLASTLHELRTPLQTIVSTTELMQDTPLNKEQREYVRQIQFSADVLLQLANDILDVSKLNSGEMQMENIPFDISELVEHVVDLVAIEAFEKGLELATDIDPYIPKMIMGDPTRMQQVILNLVKNAVKFTEKGYIFVSVQRLENTLCFQVEDSGVGVPEDKQDLIFKQFYQVDASTTRRFGGSGLGLAICKSIVDLIGGSIGVRTNPSGGSIFWFNIPLTCVNLGNEKQFELETPASSHMLIVDDNSLALRSMVDKMKGLGIHSVETATSGNEALQKLLDAYDKGHPFTLAFIDMLMPGMDGWYLAAEINSNPKINNMKLYLMVPEGQMKGEAKMKFLNWFNGYLYKPIKRNQLLNTLVEAFNQPFELEPADSKRTDGNESTYPISSLTNENTLMKGKTVLVAEDHPVNRKILVSFLEKFGATVIQAENGQEAIERIIEKFNTDLIFMDIHMPVKSGLDTTSEIRNMGYNGIIIACTANNDSNDFAEYHSIGINDILVKPFKRDTVKQILDKWNTVLSFPKARNIMTIASVNSKSSGLWDIASFIGKADKSRDRALSMIREYISGTESLLNQINDKLEHEEKEYGNLEKLSRKAKETSNSISSSKLAVSAGKMEQAAHDNNPVALEAAKTDFALDFIELKKLVKQWNSTL